MALSATHYFGREQSFIKHHFLEHYLQRLIHKIASSYGHIVYVDGFSGPWMNRGDRFEDTSFGIALKALTDAKLSWAGMKTGAKSVRMTAHLVEQDPSAFGRLIELRKIFPDIEIITHNDNFIEIAAKIASAIPVRALKAPLISILSTDAIIESNPPSAVSE